MTLQRKFSASWTLKAKNARRTALPWRCLDHRRYNESPIRRKSVVQIGPKSQLGGVNAGFSSAAYQFGIELIVNIDPTPPTASHTAIDISSRGMLTLLDFAFRGSSKTMAKRSMSI